MTATNTHDNETPRRAPECSLAWRAGAAVGARRWPKRLGAGIVAWIAVGLITAWLDPRSDGYGVIDLFGRVGYGATFAWLASGIGLGATGLIAHAQYHRRGLLAGLLSGALSLAAVIAIVAVVNWYAVGEAVMLLALIVGGLIALPYVLPLLFRPTPVRIVDDDDDDYNDDSYRYRDGWDGYGLYHNGWKVD